MKVVSVDALPAAAARTSRRASSPVLLAQPVYLWGYVGVTTLVRQGARQEGRPANPIMPMELVRVTKDNLGDVGAAAEGRGASPTWTRSTSRCSERRRMTERRRPVRPTSPSAFPACRRSRDVSLEIAAGRVTRSAARTARARARSGRFSPAFTRRTSGRSFVDGARGALRRPARRARRRRRDGAPGARLLRQPVGRRESLPRRRSRRGAASSIATRCDRRATALLAEIGARRSTSRGRSASCRSRKQQMVQIAAAVGGGAQHHRVRRADEQPESGRSRAAVRADRAAQGSAA